MKKLLFCFPVLAFILFSSALHAVEYSSIYKGIRPLGMGGAFVAVSNDQNALFFNPAGLSYIPDRRLVLLAVEAGVGQGAYDAYTDILDVDTDNELEVAQFLRDYIGEYSHASAAVFPYYIRPHFAFGIFGTANTNFIARNHQYPSLVIDSTADAGAALGYAHAFFDDALSIGASLKYVVRKSLNEEYTVPDITSDNFDDMVEDDVRDGFGTLLDLGVIYRFEEITVGQKDVVFQVGLSVNNLIGSDMDDARDLEEHVDVGIAATVGSWLFALDYFDVAGMIDDDDDPGKRIRIGVEYKFEKLFTVRAGLYQGYTTLGLEIDARYVQLDLLTYAEEVGTYAGQHSDRRYVIGLKFGF
ncbi:MAG: conjugal transfer protein TraF [Desulfomonilia bacterium]|uniref:Outer membrane protein transport protein (OMPP1/FadL/TodX) n=1 Tax=anaerobic digester metagenome TaxID=1263854 RepID=A0A485M5C3_9ZZZZ